MNEISVHPLFCSNKTSWQSVILFIFYKDGKVLKMHFNLHLSYAKKREKIYCS